MYNLYIINPCNFVVIKTIIDEEKITFLLHQLKFILVKISFSRSVFIVHHTYLPTTTLSMIQ